MYRERERPSIVKFRAPQDLSGFTMRKRRHLGIDLQDDGTHLLDLRFVDDVLICPETRNEVWWNVWGRIFETSTADNDFHFQAAIVSFCEDIKIVITVWKFANTSTKKKHQHYFHAIVSSVICFAAGQRAIQQIEPTKVNIQFHKLLLAVDGQRASFNWNLLCLCQSSCGSIRHLCLV